MRRIQYSALRMTVLAVVSVGGLTVHQQASAACNASNRETCYGEEVLGSSTGDDNSGFGYHALYSNTIGWSNTASGAGALGSNTSGGANTASGADALRSNTFANWNTASGFRSLMNNTEGRANTASGAGALQANAIGNANTADGAYALFRNTSGNENATIGFYALSNNTTGSYGTASGAYALLQNTTGIGNAATGYAALASNTTGHNNTADGRSALRNNTSGSYNTAIGNEAGSAITSGNYNIHIGAFNRGDSQDAGVTRIGAPGYQTRTFISGIRSVTTGQAGAVPVVIDSEGQLGTVSSSRRVKEDIRPMGGISERLFALRPVTFRYKQPYQDGSKPMQYGLVAEEVAEVFPELVIYGKDGRPETVSYHLLATLLLNEVQRDHLVMRTQAQRIASLEKEAARIAILEQQVAELAKLVGVGDKTRLTAAR